MVSSRRSASIVRIFARMTSVFPAAATSRSRSFPPPREPSDVPLSLPSTEYAQRAVDGHGFLESRLNVHVVSLLPCVIGIVTVANVSMAPKMPYAEACHPLRGLVRSGPEHVQGRRPARHEERNVPCR